MDEWMDEWMMAIQWGGKKKKKKTIFSLGSNCLPNHGG
jgi:hypothetical protein